jgi:hypothetical protein
MADYLFRCLNTSGCYTFWTAPFLLATAAAVETGTAAGTLATLTHHDTIARAPLAGDASSATTCGTSFVIVVFARAIAGATLV